MTPELNITTERIDDFPLLLATMQQLRLPEIMDRHLTRHGLQEGLSWGWIATIWLAHILSQGDHRKLPVQGWVRQARETIVGITGLSELGELDFTDDRLTLLLRRLSQVSTWQAIETDLGRSIIRVYNLKPKQMRVDASTASGHHAGGDDSLFQFGHSKDDPTLRQVKMMVAAMDPLGLPVATQVVAGHRADDPLYIPAVDQVLKIIDGVELLFVGDCKMGALGTRAHIQRLGHHYLCPLAQAGNTTSELAQWVAAFAGNEHDLHSVYGENAKGERELLAQGYELERVVTIEEDRVKQSWTERVLLVRSEKHHKVLLTGLEKRLDQATAQILALTPPPGRGKRQIREESALIAAASAILQKHEVKGLLIYSFERQETRRTKRVGPGRGGPNRPQREDVAVRYQITAVDRCEEAVGVHRQTLGWRIYVTNAPAEELSLEQAILAYRDEWLIERGFHRLKGAPLSLNPLFVKRDDQVTGLINLLSIAVRMLTLIEFVVRRQLKQNQEQLTGLIANNPKKGIDNPTTERLLQAFDKITLTIVHLPDQVIRHVTPLTALQVRILELLGLPPTVYTRLTKL
ncbi:MAG TPA: IS1634 family transposase [Anaerolineae bacterium]|nr:IS1634 family transposase [Anaerolineae bacterium]